MHSLNETQHYHLKGEKAYETQNHSGIAVHSITANFIG